MELESQLSEIKEVDYNSSFSKNSSNYIYQKGTTNDKHKTILNELKNFNYDNVATNKMRFVNFNYILNSVLKLKDSIKNDIPLKKYIQHAKPITSSNINLTLKEKKMNKFDFILKTENKLITKKLNKKLNKEIINLNNKNNKNFYFARMCNIETKKMNSNITNKIILIQKNIRGFLSKKIIYERINSEIAKNIINSVLMIQREFRKFLIRKKSLDKYIIKIIQKERKNKCNKIIDLFSLYHYHNYFLKHLLIKKIVITRYLSAQLIQSTFKSYILRRKVLKILKLHKNSYELIYPFEADSVKIKIFTEGFNGFKAYEYYKCPIRECFITYIDKKNIKPGKYLCQMIINGNTSYDKRYKVVSKNDNLYNIIPIGNYQKKKPKKSKVIKNIKDKEKQINDELDNFYFYYYNNIEEKEINKENSISSNSDSYKNYNKNNINYLNQLDENDPDQVIDISKNKNYNKMNNFYLKSNYNYVKDYNNKKKEKEFNENKIKNMYDNLKLQKDDDSITNSEYLNYNNILDELSQSAKSFTSNISIKNINFYSKKTHKTKFQKNNNSKSKNIKKSKKKKYDIKF